MATYTKYIDSGIKWIGEVPEHWEMKRIRHIADIFGRIGYRGYKVTDLVQKGNGAITISPSNMKAFHMEFDSCTYLSWDKYMESPEIMIYNEDILFVKTGSTYGKSSFVQDLPEKATINPQIVVLKNIISDNKLLWYIIISNNIQFQVEQSVVGGTIPTISQARINNYLFPIPPTKTEQTAIANYLDSKTADLDHLIAEKKQLVKLYQEEKTAIINQAVTKGINPNTKLKDSDIEWLGDIPEHWEVKKLNWCFKSIGSGTTPKSSEKEYYNKGTHNWLLTGDLNEGEIHKTTKKITDKALEDYTTLKEYPINSVVIAMYGATIGKLGILKVPTTVNQACCVFSEPILLNYKFAFYILLSAREEIINMSYGGGQPNISQLLLRQFKIQVPPKTEQTQIVDFIEKENQRVDVKITKAKKYIKLLTEYRTTLISEVVTGKIKVID